MNNQELAEAMLEWARKRIELNELETKISEAVLALGKTQTVGNARATYNNGRAEYDYEAGALDEEDRLINSGIEIERINEVRTRYSKFVTDWRAICKEYNAEAPIKRRSPPSVKIKLLN